MGPIASGKNTQYKKVTVMERFINQLYFYRIIASITKQSIKNEKS